MLLLIYVGAMFKGAADMCITAGCNNIGSLYASPDELYRGTDIGVLPPHVIIVITDPVT